MKHLLNILVIYFGKESLKQFCKRIAIFFAGVIIITVVALCFCSCSPQKQLANLLAKHPELRQDTILRIDTFFVMPADSNSITFTIDDLLALDVDSTAPNPANSNITSDNSSISVATNGCDASITHNANGSYTLNLKQKPDTITVEKEIQVPVYLTKTEYKDKIVYQMNKWQTFCYVLGCILFFLLVAFLLLLIARFFISKF